jgi:hypothetical protein
VKNKNFFPLHLIPVAVVAGALFFMKEEKIVTEPRREPTSIPKQKRIHPLKRIPTERKTQISRAPASVKRYNVNELAGHVVPHSEVGLSRGNILAANLGAIPLVEWKPSMAPLVYDDGVYGYFKKAPGDKKSIPVAWNPRLKGFYPVSSVLHVKGVDQATREKLRGEGFQEYIYFKNIQKLSLKRSPGEVVKLYQELEKRGYNVKLEVLRDRAAPH